MAAQQRATRHQAPKGTFDVLPADEGARSAVAAATAATLSAAGYARIETPIFEDTGLFERGVGESTDIVRKEMFTFEDQGGRSVTLRPEGTAPICRAYVEHGMHKLAQPVKLWYQGPYFRYERPQEGRFRQFNQIGAEAIGADSPLVDAELIILLDRHPAGARDQRSRAAALVAGLEREPGRLPRGAARLPARPRNRSLRRGPGADRLEPDAGLRRRRSGDPRGDGRRPADDRPARGAGRRALRHVKRAARRGRRRLHARRLAGARPRLLQPDRLRVRLRPPRRAVGGRRGRPLRRPGRAARRPSDPRRRLGGGDRARSCWRWRALPPPPASTSSSSAAEDRDRALRPRRRAPRRRGSAPTSTSAGAASRGR